MDNSTTTECSGDPAATAALLSPKHQAEVGAYWVSPENLTSGAQPPELPVCIAVHDVRNRRMISRAIDIDYNHRIALVPMLWLPEAAR